MAALDWSLGDLLKIVLTVIGTAGASMYAARRAVAHELTKQRNARGLDRRAQWYEKARGHLRQLSVFAHALTASEHPLPPLPGEGPFPPPPLQQQFVDAEARVHELILDAAVYATPETVERLNTLGRTLVELGEKLPHLMRPRNAEVPWDEEFAQAREYAANVRTALIRAFAHILDETRELHGYGPLPIDASPLPEAMVNATLNAPRRLTPASEQP
jgi:hypothetical protein